MAKIGVISLGCAKNQVNCEQMMYRLQEAGHEILPDVTGADVVLINTCGFIDSAKSEAIDHIIAMGQLKEAGVVGKILVTGCLSQRYQKEILEEMPEVDGLLGTGSYGDVVPAVEALLEGKPVASFGDIHQPEVETGRVLTTSYAIITVVLLLGAALAEKLEVEPGELLSVSGVPFWVRGVITQSNELSQVDASGAVFLPIAVFCEWMGQSVHEIILSVPEGVTPQAVAAMAQDVMRVKRDLAVDTVTMQVQIEAANSVMSIFVDVLKWVAAICILVGGIGVMNILLVSVRERRREIGIMKSLGTTEGQICLLFLLEALVYALVGGCMGLVIGVGLIETAGRSIGLTPVIRLGDCVAVFLAALAVGLIFGVSPASRASRMKPVDALRDE